MTQVIPFDNDGSSRVFKAYRQFQAQVSAAHLSLIEFAPCEGVF